MRSWIQVIKASLGRPQMYFAVPSASLEKSLRTSDEDSLGNQDGARALLRDEAYSLYHQHRRFGVLSIITVTCVLVITAVAAFLFGRAWQPYIDQKCMRHSSTYCLSSQRRNTPTGSNVFLATVMDQVSNKLHDVKFNGISPRSLITLYGKLTSQQAPLERILSFLVTGEIQMKPWTASGTNGGSVSLVRGVLLVFLFFNHDLATPRLTNIPVKYASFSRDEFAAMGMDLEGSAKFTEDYGGGYIGFLEISHKMHVSGLYWNYSCCPATKLTEG